MKKKNTKSFLLLCIVLCMSSMVLCSSVMAKEESIDPLAEKARQIADTIVNNYGVSSVQYAIMDNGNIILSGSSGVFDKTENRC